MGFRGKEELVQAGATYTVSKPSDIKDILNDCSIEMFNW